MQLRALHIVAIYCVSHACYAQTAGDCNELTKPESGETLMVWNSSGPVLTRRGDEGPWETKFGQLRAIAVVKEGQILEPRNAVLERGESLWNASDVDQEIVLTDIIPLNLLVGPGNSWCLFSAEIDQRWVEVNSIFASDRDFHLRQPTESEQAAFTSDIYPLSYCANRAGMFLRDVPPEELPPCDAPELIGLSDIDRNQSPEFWTTEILRYATGIAIWEYDAGHYIKIFASCPLCGD